MTFFWNSDAKEKITNRNASTLETNVVDDQAIESMPMETMKVHVGQKKFTHFIKGKIALFPIEKLFPFLRNWNI
jgi:hypothetical protein